MPRSVATQRIYDMAAEGRYTKREIVIDAARLVPTGQSARYTMKTRRSVAKRLGYEIRPQGEFHLHRDLTIHGSRNIAANYLWHLIRTGRLIIDEDGIVRLGTGKQ